MNSDPSLRAIFNEALDQPDAAARTRYLDEACGADTALRERVEKLLHADDEAGGFFSDPNSRPQAFTPVPSTLPTSLPVTEKAGDRIGRYKLLQQIGEGGCGVVYMAEQEEPVRRRVALKVIKLGMDTKQVVARFEAERQALALMDHPNIARVLDVGATDSGRPYFVMELVRGLKITEFCDDKKLSTQERLDLFMHVCAAIQHAHQKGIIHRDLKPSNILVTLIDGAAVPKVIDFGIAKATNNQPLTDKTLFTAFEQFIGTPAYMSPEQAEMSGVDVDTRTDIYSLGVVLYELLTGKTPFDAEALYRSGIDEIRRTIREIEPPKPSTRLNTLLQADLTTMAQARHTDSPKLVHQVRGDLDWVVMKCLEKDRNRRYETANGLANDIQRHLANQPVAARSPSGFYRFQKFARRNKVAFAAASAVSAALIAGLIISTWQAVRATHAEREQIRLRQDAEGSATTARTAAAKSQQVAAFMKDMLNGVGPSVALGRDTTMLREILDKTAERVHKDLKNEPEVEAELCDTLGHLYLELGDYPKGESLLKQGLELRRKLYGNQHRLVSESLLHVAQAILFDQNQAAESLAREALAICRQLPGGNEDALADAVLGLAMILTRESNLIEAEPLHREAIATRRKFYGAGHLEVAEALAELAYNLDLQGRRAESEGVYREALAMEKKLFGNEHPSIAITLVSLGSLLEREHQTAEAEGMYRECLAMQQKLLGNEHPQLGAVLWSLASLLEGQGNTNEAKVLHEQWDAIAKKTYGEEAISADRQLKDGALLVARGRAAEAEPLIRAGLAGFKKHFGNDYVGIVPTMSLLAGTLAQQGKWAEAEALHDEALALCKRSGSANQPPGARVRLEWARTLQRQGKRGEAETLLREAALIFEKTMGTGSAALGYALTDLVNVLARQGKLAEAETILKSALEKHRTLHGNESVVVSQSLSRLVELLLQEQKFAEAEPLARECLMVREKLEPDEWTTFSTRSMIGSSLLGQKRYAEAEPFLLSGFEGMKQREQKIPGWGKRYFSETIQHLAQLCEATARPDQAAEWRKKLNLMEDAETAPIRAEIEKAQKEHGAESWEASTAMMKLSQFFMRNDRADRAEPVAREILRIREKANPDHIATWKARGELGEVLTKCKLFAEAEPLLLSAYEGIVKRKDRIKPGNKDYIAPLLKRIVAFYEAANQPDQADDWKKKLAEFDKADNGKKAAAPKP